MKPLFSALFLVGLLGCSPTAKESAPNAVIESTGPRHPVTEKMKTVTDQLAAMKIQDFSGTTLAGDKVTLSGFLEIGPVVIFSIKEGCPCSTDFQPFANAFAKRYEGRATVLGVYNEEVKTGLEWAKNHSVKHPIISDPSLGIVKQLKQERSVYVTLISTNSQVAKSWAGYSKQMLLELDGLLLEATKQKMAKFDTAYAPVTPASGCQLFQGEGFAKGDLP